MTESKNRDRCRSEVVVKAKKSTCLTIFSVREVTCDQASFSFVLSFLDVFPRQPEAIAPSTLIKSSLATCYPLIRTIKAKEGVGGENQCRVQMYGCWKWESDDMRMSA
jgi:hypothetical protein